MNVFCYIKIVFDFIQKNDEEWCVLCNFFGLDFIKLH
jgi:hypothetical protein